MTSSLPYLVPLAKELDENKVTPGVLGFIVFAALGGAVWLLMKSMNKQFGKIDFEEQEDRAEAGEAAELVEALEAAEAAGEPVGTAVGTGAEGGAGANGEAEAEAGTGTGTVTGP